MATAAVEAKRREDDRAFTGLLVTRQAFSSAMGKDSLDRQLGGENGTGGLQGSRAPGL